MPRTLRPRPESLFFPEQGPFIFDFNFIFCAKPYASRPLVSTSDRLGRGCVASAARLAVPLTGLVCLSLFNLPCRRHLFFPILLGNANRRQRFPKLYTL